MSNENNQANKRNTAMTFDKSSFGRLVINDLSGSRMGRGLLKKYKQSEVREIIEKFTLKRNQEILREISQTLFAKSPQYQRLLRYFSDMALFNHIITPIKDIEKNSKAKVRKQFTDIGELVKMMNLKHEMQKVLRTAFKEDVFYGYIHKDKKSFYIQKMPFEICQISSVEDGVFNYSIDMGYFLQDEKRLEGWATEIQLKYREWKVLYKRNTKISTYVELDAQNTICIKINEEMQEIFPPFAGSFDAIFDIEAFKQLRKDKEELGNYMVLVQKLPMRNDSDDNNDFLIDEDMMRFFHNMAGDTVPDNVGVITSPMEIEPIKFDKDRVDSDGVAKAERDFWSGSGTSQLLFNADKSTSQGLLMSIKTDEEIVFGVLTQIERWINRYLNLTIKDLMFNVSILHITHYNRDEMFKMFIEAGQYGVPVKSHISATVGLSPIEMMNMAYLENDVLELNENWKPLISSHTMNGDEELKGDGSDGAPKKDPKKVSDETARGKDKAN